MNNSLDNPQRIQAYFSHSYREGDRSVNLFFWELFSDEGFFFTIDPKSDAFIIPHLELLMRFSDCFISVVTRREEKITHIRKVLLPQPYVRLTHSPYIAFENFLAELADKPRLLFVENGLKLGVFGAEDCVFPFDRNILHSEKYRFKEIVRSFARKVRTYMTYNEHLSRSVYTGKAGILIQESQDVTGYTKELIDHIEDTLSVGGYSCEVISPRIQDGLQSFIRQLSDLELIVIDVSDPAVAADALAVIQTKAIPCIRIARSQSDNLLETLKSQGLLKDYFIGNDIPVIVWSTSEELITNLLLYVSKFKHVRTPLETYEQGFKYFISAGRKPAKIFISNPGSLNPLALQLVNELQTLNIQYFQYQSNSRIEVGRKWEEVLDKELHEFNIFVALINNDFHISPYCQKELRTAYERYQNNEVTILPYLCDNTELPPIIRDLQFEDVQAFPSEKIVEMISKQIEKELYRKEDSKVKSPSVIKDASGKINVLFLASNPAQTEYLNLDIEVEKIDKKIRSSEFRDKLDLKKHFAQRPGDLQENLLRYKPTIVHFSGHGENTGELLFMDDNGQPIGVSIEALKTLFMNLKGNVRMIVLNACYSKNQAQAISEVIDFVIGMNLPISDESAITFSAAFYQAIAYGSTVQEAFNLGKNAISLEGLEEEETPELFVQMGVDASTTRLIS